MDIHIITETTPMKRARGMSIRESVFDEGVLSGGGER